MVGGRKNGNFRSVEDIMRTRITVINDPDLWVTQLEDGQLEIAIPSRNKAGQISYHRKVLSPGQYVGDEDPRIKTLATRVHRPEVIAEYQAEQERNRLNIDG